MEAQSVVDVSMSLLYHVALLSMRVNDSIAEIPGSRYVKLYMYGIALPLENT